MNELTGTSQLVRLALRRDRIMLPLWLLALVGTVASTISAFNGLYPDAASRAIFAASIEHNTTFRAFYGPLFNAETNGGLTAWRVATIGTVILGLMSTFLITRHTRQEEETGRLELVGSTVVGRRAPLTAALAVAGSANVVAGVLSAAVLLVQGEDPGGSFALGLGMAGGGLVFTGIAAIAAQLAETARAANGITVGVLGAAFVLRAAGDGGTGDPSWLSWISPIGWVEQVRAFDSNRFGMVGVLVVATAALVVGALALNGRRDLGGSLLQTRRGPARAARSLAGPIALNWRLQRANLAGWTAAFLIFGAVFGSLAKSIGELVESSPQMAQILRQIGGPGALIDAYFVGILSIMALMAAAYGVSAMLRIRHDESAVLAEPLLATSVRRSRLLTSYALFAFVAPTVLMLLAGVAAGLTANATLTDSRNYVPVLLGGAAAQMPAVWVVSGAAALLFGLLPRWSAAAWGILAGCALLAELGPTLKLPQAVMDLSPFSHTPQIPGPGEVAWTPLLALAAVALLLVAAGFVGFRRRDIG
jgi:ABC-2 type transport system permease protein